MTPPPIPLIRAAGSHREVGGRSARRRPRRWRGSRPRPFDSELVRRYRAVTLEHVPWIVEELDGAAESDRPRSARGLRRLHRGARARRGADGLQRPRRHRGRALPTATYSSPTRTTSTPRTRRQSWRRVARPGRACRLHARERALDQRRLERRRPLRHRQRGLAERRARRHPAPAPGPRRAHPQFAPGRDRRQPAPGPLLRLQLGARPRATERPQTSRPRRRARRSTSRRGRLPRAHEPLRPRRRCSRSSATATTSAPAPASSARASWHWATASPWSACATSSPTTRTARTRSAPRQRAQVRQDGVLVRRRRHRRRDHVRAREPLRLRGADLPLRAS